jgi:Zn-dependent protease
MLDRIVEAAVRNRLLVVLALIALVGAAALLLPRLNLDGGRLGGHDGIHLQAPLAR